MAFEHKSRRIVRFAETDMAGIVHFSEFFKYMENAEHDFYRELGLSVHFEDPESVYGWPRVHASFDYLHPLRFENEFEVHLVVEKIASKTIDYRCLIRKIDEDRTLCARGRLRVICITKQAGNGKMSAAEIPPFFREKIESAPPNYIQDLE